MTKYLYKVEAVLPFFSCRTFGNVTLMKFFGPEQEIIIKHIIICLFRHSNINNSCLPLIDVIKEALFSNTWNYTHDSVIFCQILPWFLLLLSDPSMIFATFVRFFHDLSPFLRFSHDFPAFSFMIRLPLSGSSMIFLPVQYSALFNTVNIVDYVLNTSTKSPTALKGVRH